MPSIGCRQFYAGKSIQSPIYILQLKLTVYVKSNQIIKCNAYRFKGIFDLKEK